MIKKTKLLYVFLCASAFLLSFIVSPYHFNGDQVHYQKVYSALKETDIWTGRQIYLYNISSYEYVHFLVVWVSSNLNFNKTIVMSVMNALLTALFTQFLLRKTENRVLVFALVVTNVYIYTMFFTLEKLKFGFIFLLLAINFRKQLWLIFSSFAHVQILFIVINYFYHGICCVMYSLCTSH